MYASSVRLSRIFFSRSASMLNTAAATSNGKLLNTDVFPARASAKGL